MNKNSWNKISPEDQKTIMEINEEWIEKTGKAWDESDEEGAAFLKEQDVEMIELSEEEGQRWAEAVQPILDEYVEKTNAQGLPGDKALETAKEAVAKYKDEYQ
jgi:TRAP-type C4-dicarboxylate transport system substrate-binding protein